MRFRAWLSSCVVVVFAVALLPACKRSKIGGPCSRALDCEEGTERCLKDGDGKNGFCAKGCTTNADCPAGLTCQAMKTSVTGGVHGSDTASFTMHYCH